MGNTSTGQRRIWGHDTAADLGPELGACYQKALVQVDVPESYPLQPGARDCLEGAHVKERHFITTLSLYAKRDYTGRGSLADTARTGKVKEKSKIKGDGKGKKGRTRGKPICYRDNGKSGCKKGAKCPFSHVCLKCFGDHPLRSAPMLTRRIRRGSPTDSMWLQYQQWCRQRLQSQCYTCLRASRGNGICRSDSLGSAGILRQANMRGIFSESSAGTLRSQSNASVSWIG